jgi:thiosulfate/3-mercaptopyruvate sulfurtransferase
VARDIISKSAFETLLGASGITNSDTVVLYGDNNNWFAAYAFWLFKIYGHSDVRLMNGGRVKWLNEPDKKLTTTPPAIAGQAHGIRADLSLRARVTDVLKAVDAGSHNLDRRAARTSSPARSSRPWGSPRRHSAADIFPGPRACPGRPRSSCGTFKTIDDLKKIYLDGARVDAGRPTIAYCRIGERSSHTWFVLRYLIGLDNVRNYDGSWTEYGSMIGLPIERAAQSPASVS